MICEALDGVLGQLLAPQKHQHQQLQLQQLPPRQRVQWRGTLQAALPSAPHKPLARWARGRGQQQARQPACLAGVQVQQRQQQRWQGW